MTWPEMMRVAARLGVSPEAFWRLSLKEWRWLTGAGEAAAMTRTEMERLAERWPDVPRVEPGPRIASRLG